MKGKSKKRIAIKKREAVAEEITITEIVLKYFRETATAQIWFVKCHKYNSQNHAKISKCN